MVILKQLQGIRFIHNSAIHYHGNLKWQNCLIDSRWVLKVTDFGLPSIYEASKCTPVYEDKGMIYLWPNYTETFIRVRNRLVHIAIRACLLAILGRLPLVVNDSKVRNSE